MRGRMRAADPGAYDDRKTAGTLLFLGAAPFVVGRMLARAVCSEHSISENCITDLGVWSA